MSRSIRLAAATLAVAGFAAAPALAGGGDPPCSFSLNPTINQGPPPTVSIAPTYAC